MKSTCIPHTELPGTSALFADYLYHFNRVSRFYAHDPHDPESVRRAAFAASLPDDRRQQLVAALRKTNGDSAPLSQLELPDTVAVVTGQQVGLFSGPSYTIYKALTAAHLARQLTESGIRAVPVFWLATEDHDFDEINHAWVFNSSQQPLKLAVTGNGQPGRPVGAIEIASSPVDQLASALRGMLYADEVISLVEETYRPGRTFGEAFRELLKRLLSGYGLIFMDPLDPEIRRLAAPLLRKAFDNRSDLLAALLQRGQELQSAGYHAQVLVEPQSSLFFKLENGRRIRLNGNEFVDDPAALSPNALLRPVMQDSLLPTAAYIGGPAELAYLAQSEVLYRNLLGRMPAAISRSGFTLLDEHSRSLMDRFDITLTDCFHGELKLKQRIAARLVPESVQITFETVTHEVRNSLDRLHGELRAFDPTLSDALSKSRAKILYQIEKNRGKAAREALRRNSRIDEAAAHLSSLVYPEHHLQERLYSILPFLARHGFDLLDTIYSNIQRSCPDHMLLAL